MSSTKRGRARNRHDNYGTESWVVRRFLDAVKLPEGVWLEPCAGDGAIIKAIQEYWTTASIGWTALEIRKQPMRQLEGLPHVTAMNRDALAGIIKAIAPFDVAISNPPFSLAMQFIEACRASCKHTVMLLRLNFLGSAERRAFLVETKPDIYILPNRPSFLKKTFISKKTGRRSTRKVTDSIEYAWFHWHENSTGQARILELTSKEERRR